MARVLDSLIIQTVWQSHRLYFLFQENQPTQQYFWFWKLAPELQNFYCPMLWWHAGGGETACRAAQILQHTLQPDMQARSSPDCREPPPCMLDFRPRHPPAPARHRCIQRSDILLNNCTLFCHVILTGMYIDVRLKFLFFPFWFSISRGYVKMFY